MRCVSILPTYESLSFHFPTCNQLLRWNFSGWLWCYSYTTVQLYPVRIVNFRVSLERRMLQGKAVARCDGGANQLKTHLEFSTATLPSFGQTVYSPVKSQGYSISKPTPRSYGTLKQRYGLILLLQSVDVLQFGRLYNKFKSETFDCGCSTCNTKSIVLELQEYWLSSYISVLLFSFKKIQLIN